MIHNNVTTSLITLVLGALPATFQSVFSVLLFFAGLDGVLTLNFSGFIFMIWAIAGWAGTFGLWMSVFNIYTKLSVWLLVCGIFAMELMFYASWATGDILKINLVRFFLMVCPVLIAIYHLIINIKKEQNRF